MTLRQRLRMRANRLQPRRALDLAQQVVTYVQTIASGVVRNRSSERATTPSVEFSTGTTPKSAAPPLAARNTSSMLVQGTCTIEAPKYPSAASSLKVPAGPR
jgi:hypothetical protein